MTPEERKSIIQQHILDSANQRLREAQERKEQRRQQRIQRQDQAHQAVVRYRQQVGVPVGMVARRIAQEAAQQPKNYDDMPMPLYDYRF